jgi:hypothetical protein
MDLFQRGQTPVASDYEIVARLPFRGSNDQRLEQALGADECNESRVGLASGLNLSGVSLAGDKFGKRNFN